MHTNKTIFDRPPRSLNLPASARLKRIAEIARLALSEATMPTRLRRSRVSKRELIENSLRQIIDYACD